MKLLRSRLPSVQFTVPVRGGYRANFEGHRAVVPGDVADFLLAMGAGFYSLTSDVQEALVPGATVLVIRDTGLGDVLLLTPMIRKLSEAGCIVDVLTLQRYRCLFEGNPSVRATLALESEPLDRSGYDVVLDLRLVVENAEFTGTFEHRADAFARYADISLSPDERVLTYCVNGDERAAAMRLIEDCRTALPCKGVVGYVWRSSTENRNWSEQTHLANLEALQLAGYGILIFDDKELFRLRGYGNEIRNVLNGWRVDNYMSQRPVPETLDAMSKLGGFLLDLSGTQTLRQAAALIEQCDVVITPDTGLFHLAGALNRPTLAYFGAFPAEERQAHQNLMVWNAPAACSLFPCRSYRCLNRDTDNQSACLSVLPEQIVRDVDALLMRQPPRPRLTDDEIAGYRQIIATPAAPTEALVKLFAEKEKSEVLDVTSGLGRSDYGGDAAADDGCGDGAGEPDRELDSDPAPAATVPDPAEVRQAAGRKRRTARKSDPCSLL